MPEASILELFITKFASVCLASAISPVETYSIAFETLSKSAFFVHSVIAVCGVH